MDQNNNPYKFEQRGAYTDLAIFHPNTEYIDGRSGWLFENSKKAVSIDISDISIDYPVMVFAYKKGEDITKAIPVDIVELDSPGICTMALTKGEYVIVTTNRKASFKFDREVK